MRGDRQRYPSVRIAPRPHASMFTCDVLIIHGHQRSYALQCTALAAMNGQHSRQAAANAPSAATIEGGKRDVLASLPTPQTAPADCGRADMTGAVRPAEPCRGSADSIATSSMGGDGFDVRCGGQLSSVSYHSESPDSRSFTPGTTGAFTEGGGFHSHRPSSRFAKCLCVCVCGLCTRTLLQISENTDRWK